MHREDEIWERRGTCRGVISEYGTFPVSSSQRTMPNENTSAFSRYGLCSITSGAIHLHGKAAFGDLVLLYGC